MIACLNTCGNKPSESDRFRILVMGTTRISMHSANKNSGHGSSEEDLMILCLYTSGFTVAVDPVEINKV